MPIDVKPVPIKCPVDLTVKSVNFEVLQRLSKTTARVRITVKKGVIRFEDGITEDGNPLNDDFERHNNILWKNSSVLNGMF